jgi:hypothetical protein
MGLLLHREANGDGSLAYAGGGCRKHVLLGRQLRTEPNRAGHPEDEKRDEDRERRELAKYS